MSNPTPILDTVLENNGFWPDVAVRTLVESYRVPSDGRDGLPVDTLIQAMIETNKAAAPARDAAVAQGCASLADYADAHPEGMIAGHHQARHAYLSAVYNLAKARTIKPLQVLARRPIPETETNASEDTERHFLDRHQTALANLLDLMVPGSAHQADFGVHVAALGAGPFRRAGPIL
ncbi:Phage head completion protein (GPL) [Methylomagnum ishizawai]|uniref:Phage head completion protein (GPL) n=1 Tax=Methylomagnum ishizawai TaxID=1760988 RepID=A0A1Y6D0M6_9GAMM|nr:head completion/stabilization protein [Methylomagnum ishizawai]SMF96136.1 Phage head completion protein (GPL) [Methylomagnum ishizawai]